MSTPNPNNMEKPNNYVEAYNKGDLKRGDGFHGLRRLGIYEKGGVWEIQNNSARGGAP